MPKKEYSKIFYYGNRLLLIQINYRIKDMLSWMNSISNDNDMNCIWNLDSLVKPTFNNKKFSLSKSDIYGIMDYFLDFVGIIIYMWDRYSNVVFNASIVYNNNRFGICCYI